MSLDSEATPDSAPAQAVHTGRYPGPWAALRFIRKLGLSCVQKMLLTALVCRVDNTTGRTPERCCPAMAILGARRLRI